LVQTRVTASFDGDPFAFPVDDFFVSRDGEGAMHALYAYPPGFYGHMRGCKVIWSPTENIGSGSGLVGAFVDPCGGARFARDGSLVAGPADRGLDYFTMSAGVEGMIADTRTLFCGPAFAPPDAPPTATATEVRPTLAPRGTTAIVPTPTIPLTATRTISDPTRSATPTPKPEKCDRVSPNSKR
jgi:hypothetical protein